jgi:predicted aminopeptidase
MEKFPSGLVWGSITVGIILMVAGAMAGMPRYSVWQQEMSGKAELAKAEQNRQIKIQEAKALKESAEYQAEAEIIRAKGVAKANKIIAEGLKDNAEYLKYLWINAMSEKENVTTIYIPVGQNGLPIMKEVQ